MSTIDLNSPPVGHKFNVSIDKEETSAERNVRLGKDVTLFAVAIIFVLLMGWFCVQTMGSNTATAEEKKWAMSILSACAGGLIGYLVKK